MYAQIEKCRQFANENNLQECTVYADNGYNGLTLERPSIKLLQDEIKADRVKSLIMLDCTRIARNLPFIQGFTDLCTKHSVTLHSLDGSLEATLAEKQPSIPLFREWEQIKNVHKKNHLTFFKIR